MVQSLFIVLFKQKSKNLIYEKKQVTQTYRLFKIAFNTKLDSDLYDKSNCKE